MSETDALSTFDFNTVTKPSKYLKFEAGKDVVLRVLTVDPIVTQVEYEDKKTGEITLSTKFSFIVYNFTDERAQILSATPTMAKWIGKMHVDEDFGGNIRKMDIKISPTGEKLERRYDLQVLPKPRTLTNEQIKECQAIDLDAEVKDGQRMSFYKPEKKSGYDKAKEQADNLRAVGLTPENDEEEINLDDIPF